MRIGAAKRAFAEQGALRPAQNFDPIEIPGAHVGAERNGDAGERQLVEIIAILVRAERGRDAADGDLRGAALIVNADAGRFLEEVDQHVRAAPLDRLAADRGQRDRHVDRQLLALARGDDDLVRIRFGNGIVGGLRLLAVGLRQSRRGRQGCEHQAGQAGDEQAVADSHVDIPPDF